MEKLLVNEETDLNCTDGGTVAAESSLMCTLVVFIERQEHNHLSDVNSVSESALEIWNCDFALLVTCTVFDYIKHNTGQRI